MYYNRHAHKALSLLGEVLRELGELPYPYAEDIEALAKFRDKLGNKMSDNDLL